MRKISLFLFIAIILCAFTRNANAQVDVTGSTGADASYTTLTGVAGAFNAINGTPQTGNNIVITISADATAETGATSLNAGAWTTITMSPSGGVTRTISGTVAGVMINLNGADNFTIDGLNSGGNALTISNLSTNAAASTIKFIADASNNTITRCTISGSSTATTIGTVWFSTGTTTGNIGNNINNCNIGPAGSNLPITAVYSLGTSIAIPNTVTLNANNIFDYFSAASVSIGVNLTATGNTGWTITSNRLYQTANRVFTSANTHNGMAVLSGAGYTITGNVIGFANSSGTGTTNLAGITSGALTGTFPSGYLLGTATLNATRYIALNCAFTAGGTVSSVQNNTIGGFALLTSSGAGTTNGIWCAINITSGNANVGTSTGNTIGATSGQSSVYTTSNTAGGAAVGIYATSVNTVTIQNNTIGAFDCSGTTTSFAQSFTGIDVAGIGGTHSINTNTIGNSTADNIRTGNLTATGVAGGNLTNSGGILVSATGTSVLTGIRNSSTGATSSITANTYRGWNIGGTATTCTGITTTGALTSSSTIDGNFLGTSGLGWVRYTFANSGALTGITSSATTATATLSIQTNDFRGIVHTTNGTNAHTYITNTSVCLSQNISSNTFTNLSVNTSGSVTFISNSVSAPSGGSKTINSNSIATAFNKGVAGGTVTLYTDGGSSLATAGITNNNNNFSNITVTGATTVAGWNNTDGTGATPIKTITGNTFSNWTCGSSAVNVLQNSFGGTTNMSSNTISSITGTGTIVGLQQGSSGTVATLTIASNSITSLSSTGSGGAVTAIVSTSAPTTGNINGNTINTLSSTSTTATVAGITSSAGVTMNIFSNGINTLSCVGTTSGVTNGILVSGGTTVNVYKNKIYDLNTSGAFSTTPGVNGILMSGGTTVNTYNNLIGDLRAAASTSTDAIRGLSVTSSTGSTTYNLSYNSVYITGTGGATFGNTGIFHSTSVTATTASLVLRDNNIVNVSTAAGAGLCVAYRRSSTTLTNYSATSNNNNFFGTSGLFADGTNTYTTLATFKAGMSTRDGSSVNESPTYQSTTGSSADFLKYSTGVATQLEAGAAPVGGITDDYIGTTRNVTTPDIGAWELAGIPLDLTGPSISYTTLLNAAVATSRVLTGFATITDVSGVSGGASVPRIYYKKSTDADAFVGNTSGDNGWKYVSASNGTSPYDFTIDYTIINGGSIVAADVIQYFVVAQDVNNNLSSLPVGATASGNPPVQNINAKATTPNTYTILASFSGNYNVGAGQTYTTIAAAITALNSGIVTGATTFSFQDASYSETYPLTINTVTGASVTNTVTFKPTQTGTTVTGASASGGIILSGANYVTFDGSTSGGTDKNLTIANTNTSGAVMTFQNGASNNTLKNCKFNGVSTSTSNGVLFFSTTTGTGNSSNTIQNNDIGKGATSPAYGIYNNGSATKNSANTFTGNRIFDFSNTAIFDNANSIKFVYTGNEIFQNTNQSTSLVGYRPSATTIEGFTFTRNYIHDMKTTGTGNIYGIHLFDISTGANDSGVVTNNVISISETTPLTVYGIYDQSATSEKYMVYYNSVYLGGSVTGASNSRAYNWSIASTSKVRNNIFVNARSGGSGKHYAIAYNTTYANITSDYNCIYNAGGTGNVFGFDGTIDRATIAAFRTATGKETNSVNGNPQFASTTTLVPVTTATSVIYGMNMGNASSTATTVDYNNATRNSTNPDMGAYEFTSTVNLNGNVGAITLPGGTYSGFSCGDASNVITFSNDVTVDGTLTLSNGRINMGANTMTIGTGTGNPGGLTYTSGSITGTLKRWFAAGAINDVIFPIDNGTASHDYVGVNISFTALSTGGTLTTSYTNTGSGSYPGGFIDVGTIWPGVNFINLSPQFWTVNTGDGLAGFTYNIDVNANNMNVSTTGSNYIYTGIVKRNTGGGNTWGWNSTNHAMTTGSGTNPVMHATGLGTFSDFAIGGNVDNLLPVELSTFTASIDKRNVKLNWMTNSEQNNTGFDIERKLSSSQQWSKVSFVAGHGTTNTAHTYSYEDRNLLTGKYNYRLKQIDVNGNFSYLTLQNIVDIGIPTKFDLSQNYPNPFNPTTKINYDLPFDSKVSIRLFDMTGREVAQIVNATQTAGYYTAQFNASGLASGTYFYNIVAEGGNNDKFVTTKKMVLVK